nr:SchA/CurD-like domain-containing protein [Actinospica robiniae]
MYETQTQTPGPDAATSRLRVVLLLDVLDGHEQKFLAAYDQIRLQVADVAGHISDQLCQSLGNASQWLITSEWESAEPFLNWVESEEHRAVVEPLHVCVSETRSLRFLIARETPEGGATALRGTVPAPAAPATVPTRSMTGDRPPAGGTDPIPVPPLSRGGVVRHALTFTVKPGSEQAVAGFLADYRSPQARVDDTTRLRRTSLFMRGNRVVRAVEVEGDLGNALRHVAVQPEIRAVEQAINPYLEEARDLDDPSSARAFFARAALPAVQHVGKSADGVDGAVRHAYLYPVRPGCGAEVARLLAEHDEAAVADPGRALIGTTMFLRDDTLVRLVDLNCAQHEAVESAAGFGLGAAAEELSRQLDPEAGTDLRSLPGIERFLEGCRMDPVTDRRAQDA